MCVRSEVVAYSVGASFEMLRVVLCVYGVRYNVAVFSVQSFGACIEKSSL